MERLFTAYIDGKQYTYNNASKIFILENAVDYGMDEERIPHFVSLVNQLYLKDSNDTPLDKLCDYCNENWNTLQGKSRYDILDDFYSTL